MVFLSLSLCMLFGTKHSLAQGEPLRTEERYLLSLLNRDTSTVTVAYLPHRFAFSINRRLTYQHFILVKDGKKNYFLLNGTNRVYIPDPADPQSRLLRIDSTLFEGDNFLMVAFTRKDTLFQFGGYGFWRIKDNFSFFEPAKHEWSFWNGGMAHQGSITLYQYESRTDKFYFAGKMPHDEHRHIKDVVTDTMYRYDFSTRTWETLGQLSPQIWKNYAYIKSGKSWFSPEGVCLFDADGFRLANMPGNRVYHTRKGFDSTMNLVFRGQYAERANYFPIQLGDTVYFLANTGNEPDVVKYRFDMNDFEGAANETVYTPVQQDKPYAGILPKMLMGSIPLIALLLFLFRKQVRRAALPKNSGESATEVWTGEKLPEPSDHGQSKISLFMNLLSPMEKDLVKEMASITAKNEMMEIQAINQILGVAKKDLSLQKNRRSVAISHINTVFQNVMQTNDQLILREKDDFDKRTFRYFVNRSYLNMMQEEKGI